MAVAERRKFPRMALGGNAEITSILGRDDLPDGRSTVLNCSRGGALLRVPSPQRRLFKKLAPVVQPQDSLTVVLRFPPVYQDIEVFAEVRRVTRPSSDPESLHVGIRFFYDVQRKSGLDRHLSALRGLLGAAAWGSSSAVNADAVAKVPPSVAKANGPSIVQPGRASSKRLKKAVSPAGSKRLKATHGEGTSKSKRLKASHGEGTSKSKRLKATHGEGTSKSKRLKAEAGTSKRLKREKASGSGRNGTSSKRVSAQSGRSTSKRVKKPSDGGSGRRVRRANESARQNGNGQDEGSSTVRRLTIKRAGSSSSRQKLAQGTPAANKAESARRHTIAPRPTASIWERSSAILDSALFLPDSSPGDGRDGERSLPSPRPLPSLESGDAAPPPLGLASSITAPAPLEDSVAPTEPELEPARPSARGASARSRAEAPVAADAPAPMAPVYFGLAGPESGLYIRGRGRLIDGAAVIELPEHFSRMVEARTMTVHLTPNGECFGLFVAERLPERITIRELGGGSSQVTFDYMVLGRRRS